MRPKRCSHCHRGGHYATRCPERRDPKTIFSLEELTFFLEPRKWSEIDEQFGKGRTKPQILDAVLYADTDEGGLGLLDWSTRLESWFLTEAGHELVLGSKRTGSA